MHSGTAIDVRAHQPLPRPEPAPGPGAALPTVVDPGRGRRGGQRRYITDYDGLDVELFVCTELLGLRSLHYGLWRDDDPRTLDGVRRAQRRYTQRLAARVPAAARSVLDVGCGIGDLARALAATGRQVTAISPDRNHGRFFDDGGPVRFVQSRFEALSIPGSFDTIVMSESHNYIDPRGGLAQVRRYLRRNGQLLVTGMFRKRDGDAFREVITIEDRYVALAREHGLRLAERGDITRRTAPTLALLREAMDRYLPAVQLAAEQLLRSTSPWKARLLKLAFSRQRSELQRLYDYYRERTDVPAFLDAVRYLELRFALDD